MIGGTWKGSNVCSEPVLMVEGFACDTEEWAVVVTQRADLVKHDEEARDGESEPSSAQCKMRVVDIQLVMW